MTRDITLINNPTFIDDAFIEKELAKGKSVLIQFSNPTYSRQQLAQINNLCKAYDHNLMVRFYSHFFTEFDCSIVKQIPFVKNLSIDGIQKFYNIYALTELQNLKVFKLGIYSLKEQEFLKADNFKQLIELDIDNTSSNKLNLEYIRDYKYLKTLFIEEHTKNIEAIGEVSSLEYLCLRSIKQKSVEFINNLKNLKTLRFLLGSRENINEIGENEIENLEIDWVRGFNDLSNISNFKKLATLSVENNKKLQKINFDAKSTTLTDLKILKCKTLHSLTGVENLTSLSKLIVGETDIDFDTLINQKIPTTLNVFEFYTNKKKIDSDIAAILQQKGYKKRG